MYKLIQVRDSGVHPCIFLDKKATRIKLTQQHGSGLQLPACKAYSHEYVIGHGLCSATLIIPVNELAEGVHQVRGLWLIMTRNLPKLIWLKCAQSDLDLE